MIHQDRYRNLYLSVDFFVRIANFVEKSQLSSPIESQIVNKSSCVGSILQLVAARTL